MDRKKQVLHELSLLLPAYSFMSEQYKSATRNKEKLESSDLKTLKLTNKILKKIKKVITVQQASHHKALEIANRAFKQIGTKNKSIFVIGLDMLIAHHTLQEKRISICSEKEILQLEGLMMDEVAGTDIDLDQIMEMVEEYGQLAKKYIFED